MSTGQGTLEAAGLPIPFGKQEARHKVARHAEPIGASTLLGPTTTAPAALQALCLVAGRQGASVAQQHCS